MLEFQLLINTKRYEFESSHQQRNEISKTVSEDKITPVKPLSNNQRYDSPLKSESLLKDKIRPVTPLSNSQQYNLYSNQEKGLQQPNFITLSKIPEEEQIEIRVNGVNRISTQRI